MKIRVINGETFRRCLIGSWDRDHFRDDGTCLCYLPVLTAAEVAEAYEWADTFMRDHMRGGPS